MLRARTLAAAQAAIYVGTGLWPVVHLASFEAVTGPKRERWLVKTMGLLIGAVGVTLALGRPTRETALLGAASAAALGACDVVYAAKRRISPVYLLDAVLEGAFIVGWIAAMSRKSTFGAERLSSPIA
ncbi:MAG TPA: hypothetical protein VIF62_17220 [Labilithrix sp.]